ncbi:helix-turn-helix domain-containing protein [Mucilaginibacter polytrichastri]|nr:AraC family transcriptional regulator [Mucilaginibacter polytrichastri]
MQEIDPLRNFPQQNSKLSIRIISPSFGHLPPEISDKFGLTQRKTYYFFLFMIDGLTRHGVDLEQFEISDNELLFVLPHQIHDLPTSKHGNDYYKLGFDEDCLSRLPKQYLFLTNPFNTQKIAFSLPAAKRLKSIFEILLDLLSTPETDPELILAHLHSLLTEINTAYFSADKSPADDKLSKYIGFKLFVEDKLTDQLTINGIAENLALNTNSLYSIVKHYSGLSPKEFITKRLILEAKRRIYYSESSIKELAFGLGFNDPEYFSRLFKKSTGKTINTFIQDLSGN